MTGNSDDLVESYSEKLKSILARRGSDWGFSGNITTVQIQEFAEIVIGITVNAAEIWQATYRGSDRLFYILSDEVVVAHLDGAFESAWRATAAQIAHYRTGVKIK